MIDAIRSTLGRIVSRRPARVPPWAKGGPSNGAGSLESTPWPRSAVASPFPGHFPGPPLPSTTPKRVTRSASASDLRAERRTCSHGSMSHGSLADLDRDPSPGALSTSELLGARVNGEEVEVDGLRLRRAPYSPRPTVLV